MKQVQFVLGLVLVLGATGCAKFPQEWIDSARTAIKTLEANTEVAAHAEDGLRAAQRAFDELNAELADQAKKFPLARNYDKAENLAYKVVRLSEEAPDAARANAERARRWVATEEGLNLRSEPTTKASALARIAYGQEVEVVRVAETQETIGGSTGRWTLVRWQGQEGWVFGAYLAASKPDPLPFSETFVWGEDSSGYYSTRYPTKGWEIQLQGRYNSQLKRYYLYLNLRRGSATIVAPVIGRGGGEGFKVTRHERMIGASGSIAAERTEYRTEGILWGVRSWPPGIALEDFGDAGISQSDIDTFDSMAATVELVPDEEAQRWIAEKGAALGLQ
jgi:hypothetical protein